MRKRIVFAVFAVMVFGLSLIGCRSQELCPAYTDAEVEETSREDIS